MYVCMHVYVYVYIYIHIRTYIHTNTHIYAVSMKQCCFLSCMHAQREEAKVCMSEWSETRQKYVCKHGQRRDTCIYIRLTICLTCCIQEANADETATFCSSSTIPVCIQDCVCIYMNTCVDVLLTIYDSCLLQGYAIFIRMYVFGYW